MNGVAVENPGALREMYRILQRKDVLVLLIDRPDPRGVPVTFFGEATTFPAGVAQFAIRTHAQSSSRASFVAPIMSPTTGLRG